ncbi:hypothetical protein CAI21_14000 [Alkalilimnicola ehrlichii]|uniref:Uncharacterized protein n=1 Tax=Alkalilimnicola ehrlichii TaxID=351052 RepID=A0A3E0WXN8_9GAMM|nr:hypothetical protein [Alkalilimnicola ehrlichii]RFA27735.1 hypothetical protein CAI21_14000 [Alkalilimnicola ehrlichii]RFA36931.1 hypothetical protein CAL65_10530 [Alkalilimnicola ehrlichii]
MQRDNSPGAESLVLFLCALFLFASPFTFWWFQLNPPWFVPYVFWLGLTAVTGLLARRWRRYDL